MAPVAAKIISGLPPTKAITTVIQKDAYKPTIGSTPAIIKNAIASRISARATVVPAKISPRIVPNHSCLYARPNF